MGLAHRLHHGSAAAVSPGSTGSITRKPEKIIMDKSKTTQRIEDKVTELGGALQKNVGVLLGDEQMELEGKVREIDGKARREAHEALENAEGYAQEVAGNLQNRLGTATHDERMAAEGRLMELKGQSRQNPKV